MLDEWSNIVIPGTSSGFLVAISFSGKSESETFGRIRQTAISKWSDALQSVEGEGIESMSRVSRIGGIFMNSSTRLWYVLVFSTFRQSKTTCCRRVYRHFEYFEEYRSTDR